MNLKRLLLAAVLTVVYVTAVDAQVGGGIPAQQSSKPFVDFEACPAGSHSEQSSSWESGWGSYHRAFATGSTVEIKLRNIGNRPANLRIVTLFFAKPPTGGDRVICGVDAHKYTLVAKRSESYITACAPVTDTDRNYAALGQRYQEGLRFEGWSTALYNDDTHEVLKVYGSNVALEGLYSEFTKLNLALQSYRGLVTGNAVSADGTSPKR